MPWTCSVCGHPERTSIDGALVRRTPYRGITRRFGVGKDALSRHLNDHIAPAVAKIREEEEARGALDVVRQLRAINSASLGILKEARDRRDADTALKAVDRVLKQLELVSKLAGTLDERPQINIAMSPEWLELRAVIILALEPHGAAKNAVLRALKQQGGADGRA